MLKTLRHQFNDAVNKYVNTLSQNTLYAPIRYMLSLDGKRVRPVLVLLSGNAFNANPAQLTYAALAIEIFHNFTLVHDDIMDKAPLRRGEPTVHEKWNENTAILSGDAMMIEAYKMIALTGNDKLEEVMQLFNDTALKVCEGQQLDMDFEERTDVTAAEYIEMISLKTATLLGGSLKMGALLGKASKADAEKIYNFGKLCGIAFQIQDDYLDAFGNPHDVGKQVGGDIVANKKTYLIIKALETAAKKEKEELEEIYFKDAVRDSQEKVSRVLDIFKALKIDEVTARESDRYFEMAREELDRTSLNENQKAGFLEFLNMLQKRRK